jgi:GH25 family lysozyme M1 (1,4-beta-N-acetylmuramidase)
MGEQVAFYFDQVASVQKVANEEASWIFACDYEDPNVPLSDVAYFCEQLEAVIGRPPVLYTGFATKDKIKAGQDPTRLTRFPLWLAHYASEPVLPEGWDKYWGWQYSEKASVPGIVAPTDTNAAWEGATEEEFIESWTGQAAIDVIPEPPDGGDPALKPAEVHLWVPPGTALSLVVNGSIVYEGKAP